MGFGTGFKQIELGKRDAQLFPRLVYEKSVTFCLVPSLLCSFSLPVSVSLCLWSNVLEKQDQVLTSCPKGLQCKEPTLGPGPQTGKTRAPVQTESRQ